MARPQARPLPLGLAESAVGSLFFALTQLKTVLPLAAHSETGQCFSQRLVLDSGVDFGCGNVPVARGPLYQSEVAGLRMEPCGEGMAKRVHRERLFDTGNFEPVPESQLHLARAKSAAAARTEEWSIRCPADDLAAELLVEEHGFFASTLGCDGDSPLSKIDVTRVQSNKRAEPDAGSKQQREHGVVSAG